MVKHTIGRVTNGIVGRQRDSLESKIYRSLFFFYGGEGRVVHWQFASQIDKDKYRNRYIIYIHMDFQV